ncbi:fungal fruit body lectin [Flammula alnicola]|nr:fungal fruit body lectin [Flammula alnicola]
MSYKITLRIYQTNPNAYFRVVEQTVYKGTWTEADGERKLSLNNSGVCGTIRLVADNGENFLVAIGIHDFQRWCDIVTNLGEDDTGLNINPQYCGARSGIREKKLSSYSISNVKGRKFSINFTVAEGNDLKANVIIG